MELVTIKLAIQVSSWREGFDAHQKHQGNPTIEQWDHNPDYLFTVLPFRIRKDQIDEMLRAGIEYVDDPNISIFEVDMEELARTNQKLAISKPYPILSVQTPIGICNNLRFAYGVYPQEHREAHLHGVI